MRFNPYDNVMVQPSTVSSVAIQSLTGSSAVNGDSVDTAQGTLMGGAESIMIHVRGEIASGSPSAATVAWALQECSDNATWVAANDNTGTAIGATLNVHTTAQDSYVRVEGINLQNTGLTAAPKGGRQRYLRIVLTPAFTSGTSPAILAVAEFIGAPGNGVALPVRTTVSNT
jgi:hypothetical protein